MMDGRNRQMRSAGMARVPPILLVAGAAVVIGVVYLWGTLNIHVPRLVDPVGPRAFPILVGLGMLASAVVMFVEHVQNTRKADRAPAEEDEQPTISWIVGGIFVWTLAYIAVFEWLGYIVATLAYIGGLMFTFHRGKPLVNLLTAVLFSAISYYLLAVLLRAQLPPGELFRNLLF